MKSMYDVTDAISYGFMYDLVCNEHKYTPLLGHKVLDLGAHYGFFSLFCASHGADVVAYEPDPENYEKLEHASVTASAIGAGKIKFYKLAVWSSLTHLKLNRDHHSGTSNVIGTGGSREAEVGTVSFGAALAEQAEWDCVKMDIEGAEFEILPHATDEDLQKIKYLTLELHPHLLAQPQEKYDALVHKLETNFVVETAAPYNGMFCKMFCTRKCATS